MNKRQAEKLERVYHKREQLRSLLNSETKKQNADETKKQKYLKSKKVGSTAEVSKAQPPTKGAENESVEERYKTDESAGGQSNTEASSGEKDAIREGIIGSKIKEIPKGNEGIKIECVTKYL